ncbi:helicase POLQ-like [Parasteatoda tepidariorum]|uniref:helicase POLQ-like n=1 Tax=Parasteatoda tepidariorum TaxID=114398 RepID=UPI00077FE4D8|nr:helicase POLQ-like [Parasteatoda tepidariorum]XP_015925919.1 helicase POLQ-like [Parasteatoda tepidariorum]XP_015925920.1 helicase POLQ-like [Parasteatoda tepidariorum]
MDSPSFSAFLNNVSNLNEDFSFVTSTPVAKKRLKRTYDDLEQLNPCNITCEFMDGGDFSEYLKPLDESSEKVEENKEVEPINVIQNSSCPLFPDDSLTLKEKEDLNNSNTFFLSQSKFPKGLPQTSVLSSSRNYPTSSESISSRIIQKLKHNVSSSPKSPFSRQLKRTSLLFALNEAQKLHEQLSQTSVGPFFGLPSKMISLLKSHKGIEELYTWQNECLMLPAVKQKRNLIYSLPTSGGKTLVAEILIIRELLCYFKDAILVLPYISLVQEKVRGLAPFAVDLDFVIEECAGIKGTIPPRRRRKRHTLYICTIEKAHSLVNSMIEDKRMGEIGLVVVDELHMIGEKGGRGAVLESLLTKVLFTSKTTQIIGMSATLSNMSDLQSFLNADIYEKDFRPIELKEFVKIGNELYEMVDKRAEEWRLARTLDFGYSKEMLCRDPDMVTGLIMEVIPKNSCLVFCPTKKHCENVARTICQLMPDHMTDHKKEEREALIKTLIEDGNGNICDILKLCLKYGVAYHHSGLTMDERKLIEESYLNGTLCCLTCTSTLAAGVNLPAKRVILRAPYVGSEFITYSRYKQMIGRAGRAGIDSSGESILIIKPCDKLNVGKLLTSDMDLCQSNYITEPQLLDILLLSLVGLNIATTVKEVYSFMGHTLASIQNKKVGCTPSTIFEENMQNLCEHGMLLCKEDNAGEKKFCITDLGKASFRGGVNVSTMEEFVKRLRGGLNGLALHSHLHLLYLVTPAEYSSSITFAPDIFFQKYSKLSAVDIVAAEQIGITERMVMLMASGRSLGKKQTVMHHFYITLILYDLWNQETIWSVSQKYQVHRGVIQNLLNSTTALAGTLSNFCKELKEFWAYQQLLPDFVKMLSYCVTMELIPLMELPAVKRGRAKQLYVAGFKTLADVARAHPRDLVDKLMHMNYKTANQIISAAKMIIMEKAEALQEEAENLMEEFDKNFSLLTEVS